MKKAIKLLAVMLMLCMVVSVTAACGQKDAQEDTAKTEVDQNSESDNEGKEAKDDKLKIGVIYLTLEHPYYQAHSRHTQEYAKEKGIELVELDGQIDQAKMTSQMENLIAQNVDGIVYCLLEGNAASADINAAQAAGIPVVTFAIPHNRETASCPFVGIDEFAAGAIGGKKAGEYFKEKFAGQNAKVGIVEISGLAASTDRSDGFIDGFKEVIPDAEIVQRINGEGKKDVAMSVTEDLIQANPDINVFFGANGDMGLGALAALEAQGRGTIDTELVVSHDGSEPEVLKIADPKSALKIANANQPRELARGTIDTLLEIINGERDMKSPDNIMIPAVALSADDLEFAQKFIKEQYFSDLKIIE